MKKFLVFGFLFLALPFLTGAVVKSQYVEGEILVTFKNKSQISSLAEKYNLTKQEQNKKLVLFKSKTGQSTEELVSLLKSDSRVSHVQPNYLYYLASQTTPWGVDTSGVKAIAAQTAGYTGAGVVVAVIDTGVLYTHEDLNANMWSPTNGDCFIRGTLTAGGCPNHGYNFADENNDPLDDNGHGTHVAGTIAAANNDLGVIGVAPQAQIMAVKVLPASGRGTTLDIAEGVDFAKENSADVINLSIRGYSWDQTLEQKIQEAITAGSVVVIATGNERENLLTYPAAIPEAIAVGAVQETIAGLNPDEDMQTRLAYFSNYGRVDVVAPGMAINSTTYDGSYSGDTWEGTSMATPHVAGVAALIRQKYPALAPAKVKQILMSTAQDLGETGLDQDFGAGLVDAVAALGTLGNTLILQANFTETNPEAEPTYYLPVLPADGLSTTKIKLTLADSNLNFISNQSISFRTTAGTFVGTNPVLTDTNGQAAIEITSPSEETTAVVTADAGVYGTATVNIFFTKNLLVSDAAEYNDLTVFSWFYDQALNNLGYHFVRWDTGRGNPTAEYLQKFTNVFWYTADYWLTDEAQDILKTYLNAGGNLFLSGNDIGYYLSLGYSSDIIYSTYLQASFAGDYGELNLIGENIFADYSFSLVDRGYVNGLNPDYITTPATSLAYYASDPTLKAGTLVDSTYNALYLSFGFETIYGKATRQAFLQTALQFFQEFLPPANLTLVEATASQATLSWEAVTEATDYLLSYGTDETATNLGTITTPDLTYTLENLDSNTLYYARVAATGPNGTTSFSEIISFTTSPAKPRKIKIKERQAKQVAIKWQAPSGTIASYTLSYGQNKQAKQKTKNTTQTKITLKNLQTNQKYFVKIKALAQGNSSAWTKIITFRTKPAKPKNLKASNITSTTADLQWDNVRGKIKKYILKIYTEEGKYFATLKTAKLKKYITGLLPQTTYYFKVYAKYNKNNISQGSARFWFRT